MRLQEMPPPLAPDHSCSRPSTSGSFLGTFRHRFSYNSDGIAGYPDMPDGVIDDVSVLTWCVFREPNTVVSDMDFAPSVIYAMKLGDPCLRQPRMQGVEAAIGVGRGKISEEMLELYPWLLGRYLKETADADAGTTSAGSANSGAGGGGGSGLGVGEVDEAAQAVEAALDVVAHD